MNPKLSNKSMVNIIQVIFLVIIATGLVIWTLAKPRVPETLVAFFYPGTLEADKESNEKTNAQLVSKYCIEFALDYNSKHNKNIKIHIVEGGKETDNWQKALFDIAESGKYSLVISDGIEFPKTALTLTNQFPDIDYIIFDSDCDKASNIASFYFSEASDSEQTDTDTDTESEENSETEDAPKSLTIPQEQLKNAVNKVFAEYLSGKTEFGKAVNLKSL